jgi:carbonic anhydrase
MQKRREVILPVLTFTLFAVLLAQPTGQPATTTAAGPTQAAPTGIPTAVLTTNPTGQSAPSTTTTTPYTTNPDTTPSLTGPQPLPPLDHPLFFQECPNTDLTSPINIKFPYTYIEFSLNFHFNLVSNAYLEKLTKYHFRILGDWGSFMYNNVAYSMVSIHIRSPSEHTINGLRFALEFEINAVDKEIGGQIMLVILFERNDYMSNPHLERFGLTSDFVRTMKTIKEDVAQYRLKLTTD